VDELFRLVDEFLKRAEQERPVLVLTGCRRCGKTTALERIKAELERIGNRAELERSGLPHALEDCALLPDRTPELLTALMFGLNRKAVYGRLPFPRLLTGLMIMPPLVMDPVIPARAREQVRQELEKYRNIDRLRSFIDRLGAGLIGLVPHMNEDLATTSAALLDGMLLRGLLGTGIGRKVLLGDGLAWYAHQDRRLSRDPLDVLVELNRKACDMDEKGNQGNRTWVARLLWGAFLADLDARFARHRDWDRNCAVLLDNADVPAGRRFLRELNEALQMRREHHLPDPPLTMIAASRDVLVSRSLPRGRRPVPLAGASIADYRRRRDAGEVVPGWYPVVLPSLSEIETRNLVAAAGTITDATGRATGELLSPVIFQFTAGHPEATAVLIGELDGSPDAANLATVLPKRARSEAAGPQRGHGQPPTAQERLTPHEPLTPQEPLTPHEPPTVEEWLIRSLTAGLSASTIANLVTCAAARDQGDANLLDAESRLLGGTRAARNDVFATELWIEGPPGEAGAPRLTVMLPVLRRLLLRRLAARPDDWSEVFGWLHGACIQAGDLDGELYYALALADIELVAKRLTARLSSKMSEEAAIDWLSRWEVITAAPSAVADAGSAALPGLVSWADSKDQPTESVASLVAARWLFTNSLWARDQRALQQDIAGSLDALKSSVGAGRSVFRDEADKYRSLAGI
jgi:hypothetical protein